MESRSVTLAGTETEAQIADKLQRKFFELNRRFINSICEVMEPASSNLVSLSLLSTTSSPGSISFQILTIQSIQDSLLYYSAKFRKLSEERTSYGDMCLREEKR